MKPTPRALTLVSLLLSACVNGSLAPSGTGHPSASPSAHESTGEPGATAEGTPAPAAHSAGALARDGIAEVVTDDLVVRSLPEISAQSIIAPIPLSKGKLLFVLDGPVVKSGFEWYRVAPFDEFLSDTASEPLKPGWVAAGRSGEVWIAPWTGRCPEPTLDDIRGRSPYLALACFGNDELALQGILGDCGDFVPGIVEPMWLANHYCWLLSFDRAAGPFDGWIVHQEGAILNELDKVAKGVALRVLGHFDDPAAQTCIEFTPLPGVPPTPPELVVLYCRIQFAATDITEIPAP
jgi:hypothetical protein